MAVFISHSVNDTLSFGEEYIKSLPVGSVIILKGEMGAGKTVFAKGVARGLKIDDEILSPTYAYMNDYYGKLYHFDCYRLSDGSQAERLGLTDYFGQGICLIEWAENIASVLPEKVKTVIIEKLGEGERKIIYD